MKKYSILFMGLFAMALTLSCTTDYSLLDEDLTDDVSNSPDASDSDGTTDESSGNPADDPTSNGETSNGSSWTNPYAGFITYEVDVKPIMNQLCVACHNANLKEDGVDLSSYYLTKVQFDDILKSMQEEEGEDDIMPPSGRVDDTIIETLILWKADGLLEGEAPPEDPDSGISDGNYTYTEDIAAIINDYCIVCHGASSPDAGYDISTYQKTVDQINIFIERIDLQTGQAGVMPPAGRMDEEIIQKIKDWVDQGMPE